MKIFAILPAYYAAKTLVRFLDDLPWDQFTGVILVDDHSGDSTYKLALQYQKTHSQKNFLVYQNSHNLGYGGNLQRCLSLALDKSANVIIELHPDGEYGFDGIDPAIVEVKSGAALVLGNRFTYGKPAGMYWSKYLVSRMLTEVHNLYLCKYQKYQKGPAFYKGRAFKQGESLQDLHQGFRVYTSQLLEKINYQNFSNDYIFSWQIIVAAIRLGLAVKSVPVTARYSGAKRGASWGASIKYVWQTFGVLLRPDGDKFP